MPPGPLFALYVELDLRRRGQLDLMAGRKVCGLPHSWMASMVSRRNPYETGTKPGLDQNIPTRPDPTDRTQCQQDPDASGTTEDSASFYAALRNSLANEESFGY